MYKCRHCGWDYMTDEAVMCPRCQAPKGKGSNFCPFCGAITQPNQKICSNCGVDMDHYGMVAVKSKIAAGLLGIFLGIYGAHNFYLGYTKKAILQLALVLGAYISYFSFMIAMFASTPYMTDKEGIFLAVGIILLVVVVLGVRIWTFVEGVLILCGKINRDGKGRMLK